jgi:dipeptidyl aminopeptidase/acylaminoacyl peptidase
MVMRTAAFLTLLGAAITLPALAEIRNNPGGKELPHDKYIRVVSETDSPVQQIYIKTKDGLYVAAALRKPKGNGPFPVLIHFHGAPGGRGMEQLTGWSRGDTGGPVWERFLKEGYVVVVSDYRAAPRRGMGAPMLADEITYVDDGLAVVDYVRALPYADKSKITVYGVSLGGNLVAHLIARTTVHASVLGAPAVMGFLGVRPAPGLAANAPAEERWKNAAIDEEAARKNIQPIQTPVLILVGTADGLIHVDRILHDRLAQAGKSVRMEIYENGYHDFCIGPQGQAGRKEPLLDATLDALEKTLAFARDPK